MINVVGAAGTDGDGNNDGYSVFVPTPVAKVTDATVHPPLVTHVAPTLSPSVTAIPSMPVPPPPAPIAPPVSEVIATPPGIPPIPPVPAPVPPAPPHKAIDPKNKQRVLLLLGAVFLILLLIGGGIAFYLTRVNQDIRQQASGGSSYTIPTPIPTSIYNPSATPRPTSNIPQSPTPTRTPLLSPTPTGIIPSLTPTVTPILTPTNGPSPTPTLIPTDGPSPTPTEGPSPTPIEASLTPTATPTITEDPTVAPTAAGDPTLAPSPTGVQPTITPAPTTPDNHRVITTTANCNESCTVNANCINPSHVCYNGQCRLDTNPTASDCRLPSGNTETVITEDQYQRQWVSEQPAAPGTLPVTGPEDWLKYLKVGLGILGVGSLLLLLL